MSFRIALGFVVLASAFAGFVQGAGPLASPPAGSAVLDERPRRVDGPASTERTTRFWKPETSTATKPESTLRQVHFNPYLQRDELAGLDAVDAGGCTEAETTTC